MSRRVSPTKIPSGPMDMTLRSSTRSLRSLSRRRTPAPSAAPQAGSRLTRSRSRMASSTTRTERQTKTSSSESSVASSPEKSSPSRKRVAKEMISNDKKKKKQDPKENGGGGNESDATSACSFATACTSLVPSVTSAVVVAPSVIQEEQEEELFEEEDEETTRSPSPVRVPLQVKVVSFSNRDLLRGIQGLPLVRLRRCDSNVPNQDEPEPPPPPVSSAAVPPPLPAAPESFVNYEISEDEDDEEGSSESETDGGPDPIDRKPHMPQVIVRGELTQMATFMPCEDPENAEFLWHLTLLWHPRIKEDIEKHDGPRKHKFHTKWTIAKMLLDEVQNERVWPELNIDNKFKLLDLTGQVAFKDDIFTVIRAPEKTVVTNRHTPENVRKWELRVDPQLKTIEAELLRDPEVPKFVMIFGGIITRHRCPFWENGVTILGQIHLLAVTSPHILIFRSEEISPVRMSSIHADIQTSELSPFHSPDGLIRRFIRRNFRDKSFSVTFSKRSKIGMEIINQKEMEGCPRVIRIVQAMVDDVDNHSDSQADGNQEVVEPEPQVRAPPLPLLYRVDEEDGEEREADSSSFSSSSTSSEPEVEIVPPSVNTSRPDSPDGNDIELLNIETNFNGGVEAILRARTPITVIQVDPENPENPPFQNGDIPNGLEVEGGRVNEENKEEHEEFQNALDKTPPSDLLRSGQQDEVVAVLEKQAFQLTNSQRDLLNSQVEEIPLPPLSDQMEVDSVPDKQVAVHNGLEDPAMANSAYLYTQLLDEL